MKPISAVSQGFIPREADISMEGESRDQKAAATITPPVNPSMASITFRLGCRMKKTTQAPREVSAQVNSVAIRA